MFIELHKEGVACFFNVNKIIRFISKNSNTRIIFDSTTNYETFVVDESYETVKQLIKNARKQGNL